MSQHSQLDLWSMAVSSFLPHPTHPHPSRSGSIKFILRHNNTRAWWKREHSARHFVTTAGTRSLNHPSRWVTLTLHAYVTPARCDGPQVGTRASTRLRNHWQRRRPPGRLTGPYRHHGRWSFFSFDIILGDGIAIRRHTQLAKGHRLTLPLSRGQSGLHVFSLSVPQIPPKYIACWSERLMFVCARAKTRWYRFLISTCERKLCSVKADRVG